MAFFSWCTSQNLTRQITNYNTAQRETSTVVLFLHYPVLYHLPAGYYPCTMAITDYDIKTEFVRRALNDYGVKVTHAMKREWMRLRKKNAALQKDLSITDLFKSIKHHLLPAIRGLDRGGVTISFLQHGRFQDMGAGRRPQVNTSESVRRQYGARKPKKFYSPIAYGYLNSLIGRVAYGYSEETMNSIKSELLKADTP